MHLSLVTDLGRVVPKEVVDPLPQAWQVAWGGHALLHQPLDYFQSNQFWPGRNTLAYSDALIGYAPTALVGSGPHAAILRYDLLWLFTFVLAFVATYLLARELGLGAVPAALAGIAFAYAPYRLEQYNHLHVLSSGGIPLALFLLVRGHRRAAPGLVLAGWLVTAWQLSLGFSLGLLLVYLLGALALVVAALWWRRGRPRPPRSLVWANVAGALVLAICAVVLARPYQAVRDELPEARRTLADVAAFSGGPWSYLATAEESTLWGPITAGARERLNFPSELELFPGALVILLAIGGVTWSRGPFRPGLRLGLAVGIGVCGVLALGASTEGVKQYSPYRVLYELAPGFEAIRVPGRITTLTTLGLALLAGAGAERLGGWVERRRGNRVAAVAAAGLALVVLFEGSALRVDDEAPDAFRTPTVEDAPAGFSSAAPPVMFLPADPPANRRYLLWSTQDFPAMVNGRSSVKPRRFTRLVRDVQAFPDAASVRRLREFGVRTVALDRRHTHGTPWEGWRGRPTAGLGVSRSEPGDMVVYDLR